MLSLLVRDRGDIYCTWSSFPSEGPQRRNTLSSAGSFPSSFSKHSQDWVIRGYINTSIYQSLWPEFVQTIHNSMCGNWSAVTPPYEKSFVPQNRTSVHHFVGPSILLHHTTDACLYRRGGRKVRARLLRPAYNKKGVQGRSKTASIRTFKNGFIEISICHLNYFWRNSNPSLLLRKLFRV